MPILAALRDRRRLVVLVAVVAVLVGLLTWFLLRPSPTTVVEPAPVATTATSRTVAAPASPTPTPSAVASIVEVTSSPPAVVVTPTPTPAPSPTGRCQAPTADGFVPVRYEIDRFGSNEKVVSLGLDRDGSIAAPPLNEPRMASWWNQGPRAGSDAGKVVLSIHTYRKGGAMGNKLYEGGRSALQPGDRITLYGADGEVACYDFVEATKVFVKDYDPASSVMVDYDGAPLLNMIICWDFVKGSKEWNSRVFFYAKPVVGD